MHASKKKAKLKILIFLAKNAKSSPGRTPPLTFLVFCDAAFLYACAVLNVKKI
jgi:hypothetical protein